MAISTPHFNPIENLWQILDRDVRKKTNKTADVLFAAFEEEWHNITAEIIKNLIDSK